MTTHSVTIHTDNSGTSDTYDWFLYLHFWQSHNCDLGTQHPTLNYDIAVAHSHVILICDLLCKFPTSIVNDEADWRLQTT